MHVTWWNSWELNGVKEKDLKRTLEMLLEESQLQNPAHERRINLLDTRRGNMAHWKSNCHSLNFKR